MELSPSGNWNQQSSVHCVLYVSKAETWEGTQISRINADLNEAALNALSLLPSDRVQRIIRPHVERAI